METTASKRETRYIFTNILIRDVYHAHSDICNTVWDRPWKDWLRYSPNTAAFSIYKTLLEISYYNFYNL